MSDAMTVPIRLEGGPLHRRELTAEPVDYGRTNGAPIRPATMQLEHDGRTVVYMRTFKRFNRHDDAWLYVAA